VEAGVRGKINIDYKQCGINKNATPNMWMLLLFD
jgi:hypothetical protein